MAMALKLLPKFLKRGPVYTLSLCIICAMAYIHYLPGVVFSVKTELRLGVGIPHGPPAWEGSTYQSINQFIFYVFGTHQGSQ